MEVIIHCGFPKTGSTSIQKTLHENSELLIEKGTFYPYTKHQHHSILLASLLDFWPREYGTYSDNRFKRACKTSSDAWTEIHKQIRAKEPSRVIISSEHLTKTERIEAIKNQFSDYSCTFHIVAYLRDPCDLYLSRVQQQIKYSKYFVKPSSLNYSTRSKRLKIGEDRLTLRPYFKNQLHNECVIEDFLKTCGLEELISLIKKINSNTTISSEGMQLMQNFHIHGFTKDIVFGNKNSKLMLRLIEYAESKKKAYYTKPQLLESPRKYIQEINRSSYEFMDKAFGLASSLQPITENTKEAVDIAKTEFKKYNKISDICLVDSGKLDELQFLLMRKLIDLSQNNK